MELLGRGREQSLIQSLLADRLARGAMAILLFGETGIGRSAVVDWAIDVAASHGCQVMVSRPTDAQASIPFSGLRDLVESFTAEGREGLGESHRTARSKVLAGGERITSMKPYAAGMA